MITYRFPTNVSIEEVVEEATPNTDGLLGAEWLPFVPVETQRVEWDEKDRLKGGGTAYHNMDADPKIGKRRGSKRHEFEPIPHKETDVINESDMLMPRAIGSFGDVIDLTKEIGEITADRMHQNKIRAEGERWQILKGHLVVHQDGVDVDETVPVQTYDVDVDWDELGTAKPLYDWVQITKKFGFTGASAIGAEAAMNSTTAGWLLLNQNEDDLKSFQNQNFLKLPYAVAEINKIFQAREQPVIRLYDEGYVDDLNNEVRYLADGDVVIKGKRLDGKLVGDYAMTPTMHKIKNGKMAGGMFSIIEVNGRPNPGAISIPEIGAGKNPKIEITGGFYGGPRLKYPRSIIYVRTKLT
jgi:hypothetical protein